MKLYLSVNGQGGIIIALTERFLFPKLSDELQYLDISLSTRSLVCNSLGSDAQYMLSRILAASWHNSGYVEILLSKSGDKPPQITEIDMQNQNYVSSMILKRTKETNHEELEITL